MRANHRFTVFIVATTLFVPIGLALPGPLGATYVPADHEAPVATPGLDLPGVRASADAMREGLTQTVLELSQAPGSGAKLALLTGVTAPEVPQTADLALAIASLSAAAGVAAPETLNLPPEPLASALAPVVAAIAEAARLRAQGFADLSAAEQEYLLASLDSLLLPGVPGDDPVAQTTAALLDRANMDDLYKAGALVASALDAFPRDLPLDTLPEPRNTFTISIVGGCDIIVGDFASDTYTSEALLIVDLGGNDVYDNRAATWAPGSSCPLGVSAILDLGGSDTYTTTTLHPFSDWFAAGQGVGLGGIGVLVDVRGDDTYETILINGGTGPCVNDGAGGFQTRRNFVYAQGVGVAGVGVLADLDGSDTYTARSEHSVASVGGACHFAKAFVFAQGGGVHGGVGLLSDSADDVLTGANDQYQARSYATSSSFNDACDPFAHTYAQGFGGDGVGVLLDAGGHDFYWADARALSNRVCVKGAFAYAFGQGVTFATRHNPAPAGLLSGVGQGLLGAQFQFCRQVPGIQGVSVEPCRPLSVGILADLYGQDNYVVSSYAWNDINCGSYVWANSIGQGAATWEGLGALVNLDALAGDSFQISSVAGQYVCSFYGVRAFNFGQGYGGVIEYIMWENPSPLPARRAPAIGVLVGGSEPHDHVLHSGDYHATFAYAQNDANCQFCPARAENWVQGAGRGTATLSTPGVALPIGFGAGFHLDAGGDDVLYAQAYASSSASANQAQALSVVQGAALDGVGVLVNAGGDDYYYAYAYENNVPQPLDTVAQASASCASGPCVPSLSNPLALPAIGILVDVDGSDYYSENYEGGCQDNAVHWVGPLLNGVLGSCMSAVPAPNGFVFGVDIV